MEFRIILHVIRITVRCVQVLYVLFVWLYSYKSSEKFQNFKRAEFWGFETARWLAETLLLYWETRLFSPDPDGLISLNPLLLSHTPPTPTLQSLLPLRRLFLFYLPYLPLRHLSLLNSQLSRVPSLLYRVISLGKLFCLYFS